MSSSARIIPRRTDAGPAPLSFSQERLWFLDQLTPGSPLYNIPVAARLEGELDIGVFRKSLGEVVRRHEVLRTRFAASAGRPVQEVVANFELDIPVIDLRAMAPEDREREEQRLAAAESVQPFDLVHGPLLRVSLVRVGDRDTVILFTVHHIVFDEWSLGIFMRELRALYDAFLQGAESPLAEPGIQYADFAVWQRQWLHSEALDAQLTYWQQKLAGLPVLELPYDYPRPSVPSHRGASQPIHVPAALTRALRDLGRRRGCTLFMTLLSAFQVLLARYSGQADFAVGVPIGNRNHVAIEDMIGFFVNTLVLRTDLAGDATFVETLSRVRNTALGAYAHQDLPFVTLVEKLQPERALSHNPLFQVIFQLIATPDQADPWESRLASVKVQRRTAIFDLTMGLEEQGPALGGAIVYSTDLFSAPTIARMAGHFVTLLESIVEQPARRISELALLTAAERENVLRAARSPARTQVYGQGIHQLVDEQVRRTPGAPALVYEDESLSYAELQRRAKKIARYLMQRGAGPETPVAVALDRSAAMVTAWLAILEAGGAYVPIDLRWPATRIRAILLDTGAKLLVTNSQNAPPLDADSPPLVLLDRSASEIECCEGGEGGTFVSGDQLAFVLYTSGSTGAPKGIGVPHRAVQRLVEARFATVSPQDRVAQVSNCAFDAATFEIWGALTRGATVHGIAHDVVLSPAELRARLERDKITHIFLTTAVFHETARSEPSAFEHVREVLFGGEPADIRSVERILSSAPPQRLLHVYGPTENATFSTCYEVSHAPHLARLPIGQPIEGTEAFILGPQMELVPIGVAGELWLGGDGLARGYINRPELTAEAFAPHPFSRTPGARLYRTGDRARLLANGTIDFLGRRDTQVKLRGHRIELQEVESALSRHSGVREAVVVVREGDIRGRRLVAYVSSSDSTAMDAPSLRAFLKERLPEYMIPAEFVFLEKLPLGPTGKLNREGLPRVQPEPAAAVPAVADAPRTSTEEYLATLWCELLQLPRVGIYDSFFELGGHSLLATHLIARVRAQQQLNVPLRTLFESPTVAGFAERIDELLERMAPASAVPPMAAARVDKDPPASFAQARLWFMDQLGGRTPLYNIPHAFRIGGALDAAALERAMAEIVHRHQALRTRFAMRDGGLVQVVAPYEPRLGRMAIEDLEGLPDGERARHVERQIELEQSRPFGLEHEIPIRSRLLREDARHWALLVTVHHIAFDGVSEAIFFRELSALYAAFHKGASNPLPDLPVQYSQYAVWQQQWLSDELLERELSFWRNQLRDLAPVELPFRRGRPAPASHTGASVWITMDGESAQALKRLAHDEGCTLFMVLLAGFQVLLHRLTGNCDIAVGTPAANRPMDAEALIGFFVNMLVMRGDVRGNPSFRELLARVRATTLQAYQHQDVPFDKIVEALHPGREISGSPLFRIVLALQNAAGAGLRLDGLEVRRLDLLATTAKYDLTLSWLDGPEGLMAAMEYDTGVLDREEATHLLEMYRVVLDAAARVPDCRVASLPLLTTSERRKVLEEFSHDAAPPAVLASISAVFEQHARNTPDALAITGAGGELTYRELDRRANWVAARLSAAGIGSGSLVALYLARSPEMIVAMLGVLQAGAAYLPLDTTYPRNRIAMLLEDARADAVVTQSRLAAELPVTSAPIVILDQMPEETKVSRNAPRVRPDDVAYVMYTSGSTGRPKGVAVTHQGVTGLLCGTAIVRLDPDTCILQNSSPGFDASTFEIWGALLNGGRVALLPPGQPSLDDIANALLEYGVTTLWLTAALFHQMVDERLESFATIRALLAGGDALSAVHVRSFLERHPHCRLVNGYGPTENTVFTTCHAFPPSAGEMAIVPIGRPVGGTTVYILDDQLEPVPIGVPGILYAAGQRLAQGYWRRPGLTAMSWMPDPFAETPGGRMYATGDVARWLPDGSIEFLGRRDRQVKIRGHRVELAEVEALLGELPSVRQAAALALSEGQDKRLVGYVVLDPPTDADARRLLDQLRCAAPSFLVPSALAVLDRLPTSANGKVDYRALEHLSASPAPASSWFAPPHGPLQELVAAIWSEVFSRDGIGADDNFFDLGGHSLLATRVVSRLRRALNVDIPLRTLFQAPTVRQLSARLASLRAGNEPAGDAAIERVSRDRAWSISPRQEVLWRAEQMLSGTPLFTIGTVARMRGRLDRDALTSAIQELALRHESLRTRFVLVDGRPCQCVDPEAPAQVEWISLAGVPPPERVSKASELAARVVQRGFDLATGPLWRAAVVELDAEDHVLAVALHHIIADGWSIGLLTQELDALYRAHTSGEKAIRPAADVDYIDCCEHERRTEAARRAHLDYWTNRFRGPFEKLDLPTDHPRTAPVLLETARAGYVLSKPLTQAIGALARGEGVTRFMTLLAIYELFLHELTGRRDVRVGVPFANRPRREYEDVVGLFTNTVVLDAKISGELTFRDLLRQTRETVLAAETHQAAPFGDVADALEARGADCSALFDTMFLYQNDTTQGFAPAGLRLASFPLGREWMGGSPTLTNAELILQVNDGPERIYGSLIYRPDLFDASTIRQMLRRYRQLAARCVEQPDEACVRADAAYASER